MRTLIGACPRCACAEALEENVICQVDDVQLPLVVGKVQHLLHRKAGAARWRQRLLSSRLGRDPSTSLCIQAARHS